MTTIKTINPATGETFTNYQEMTDADARDVVGRTHDAYLAWRRTNFGSRAALMRQAAKVLRDNAGKYAELMAREMGKPIRDGVAEIQKCAGACDYYAENAERFLATEPIKTEARKSYVIFQPLGVVLAVMPWNFPFWQVFRFAAPGLMAGNGAVMKLSSNVPGCAIAIEEVFREAGFPEHLFRSLVIGSAKVETVIENPLVRAVTLTGSGPAGRAVAGKAGSLLKKTVLELGGSDPYLVLEDPDLDLAATVCARGRLINTGQSCIAAKRFIVVDKVHDRFVELFVKRMAAPKMGDPLKQDTEIGPLARHDLRDTLHRQVESSIAKGARCVLGGEIPKGPGAYYPPTVLTNVGHARLRGRTVWPGGIRDPGRQRECRDRNRQRFGVRVGRRRHHRRYRARRAHRRRDRKRQCVRQRQCPLRSAVAVRRRQAKWLWTRAFALRHQGIRQYQDSCGGLA